MCPLSQPENVEMALSKKEKTATAVMMNAVIVVMGRHVAFERELYATTLLDRAAQTANLPLRKRSAVQVLAVVTCRRHALEIPMSVPKIDMQLMGIHVAMIRASSVLVVNVPTGICSAESS